MQSLLELLEGEHAIADALAGLLLHLDNDGERLQRLLVGLLANRDQWLRHIGRGNAIGADSEQAIRAALENTLQTIIIDALDEAASRLRVYQGDLLPLLDFAAMRLSETDPEHALAVFAGCVDLPDIDPEFTSQWCTLVSVLLKKDGDWYRQLTKNHGFPVGDSAATKTQYKAQKEKMLALIQAMSHDEGLRDVLAQLRHLPTPHYPESQWQMLRQLMLLLPVRGWRN